MKDMNEHVCVTCRQSFDLKNTQLTLVTTAKGFALFRLCNDCANHATEHQRVEAVRTAVKG